MQSGAQRPASERLRGVVVTDTLWSQALGANKSLVMYLPPSYGTAGARRYPVVLYLHGLHGDQTNWVARGRLDQVMDSLVAAGMPEMIVAMPDGDNSWYTTYNVLLDAAGCRRMLREGASPERDCVPWPHYDDYIAYDVVRHVDGKYRTLPTAGRRAVAGLSMGGYGAFTLAFQYPATFSAAASHSGVLAPREFAPDPIGQRLPHTPADSATLARSIVSDAAMFRAVFGSDSASWAARDPVVLAARRRASGQPLPALYADTGTDDIFLAANRVFRDAMTAQRVPLAYHEWPGGHTWSYWRTHVGESLSWIATKIAGPAAEPRQR